MQFKTVVGLCVLACISITSPLSLGAADGPEFFVVATDMYGRGHYLKKNADGSFVAQQYVGDLVDVAGVCYGAGVGDFDNDGDFDFIAAKGRKSGYVYLFEKVGPGSQFAPPVAIGAWNAGYYVMGAAVGDFDEDGNLDFVLSYYDNSSCELFLGDGHLQFSAILVANSAAALSGEVDTADVNNDGHLDFVTVPYRSDGKFYVNLGAGDATFTTVTSSTYNRSTYWGLAVADFNNDGNADLAATYADYLDLYTGNGDGTFTWAHRLIDPDFYHSPIDNLDVDDNGNQDLVVARYGRGAPHFGQAIAVLLGYGDGTFDFDQIYAGGSGNERTSVAAPFVNNQNKKPLAVLEFDVEEIIAGHPVVFDGTGSYDEDGAVVSYAWDFGDGQTSTEASPEHVYYHAGQYTVTLTVIDDKGDRDSVELPVYVETIPAVLHLHPKFMNLMIRPKWVLASIELPDDCDVSQIDIHSVLLSTDEAPIASAVPLPKYGFLARLEKHWFGRSKLGVKFERQAIVDALGEVSDGTILHIQGKVYHNGGMADFSGSDSLRVIRPDKQKKCSFHLLSDRL